MSISMGRMIMATRGDLLDVVHDLLDDHDAWEYIDEYITSNNSPIRVYKCLGTKNVAGGDFYVALRNGVGDNMIAVAIADDFDSQTQTIYNYIPSGSVSIQSDASSGTSADIISNNVWGSFDGRQLTLSDHTSFNYVVSVTDDRLVLAADGRFLHVGAFDTFVELENEFPVCTAVPQGSSNNGAMYLRQPGYENSGSSSSNFKSPGIAESTPHTQPVHRPPDVDPFIGTPVLIHRAILPTATTIPGAYRGFLRDVYAVQTKSGTPAGNLYTLGDTFTDEDTEDVYVVAAFQSSLALLIPVDA